MQGVARITGSNLGSESCPRTIQTCRQLYPGILPPTLWSTELQSALSHRWNNKAHFAWSLPEWLSLPPSGCWWLGLWGWSYQYRVHMVCEEHWFEMLFTCVISMISTHALNELVAQSAIHCQTCCLPLAAAAVMIFFFYPAFHSATKVEFCFSHANA